MKRILLASAATLALATAANAGGMADPVMEEEVVVEESAGTSGGFLIPLLLLVLIGAAVASGDSAPAASDIRLKSDIRQVGFTSSGLPLYQYRYKGLPQVYEGVMAQDVLRVRPDAVSTIGFGYLGVDYGKLGLTLKTVH